MGGRLGATDVIGDVTPFKFTSPYPFFLNSDYLNADGVYGVSSADAGTIIIQGLLLAIAGVVQGLMTTEVVTTCRLLLYNKQVTPTTETAEVYRNLRYR